MNSDNTELTAAQEQLSKALGLDHEQLLANGFITRLANPEARPPWEHAWLTRLREILPGPAEGLQLKLPVMTVLPSMTANWFGWRPEVPSQLCSSGFLWVAEPIRKPISRLGMHWKGVRLRTTKSALDGLSYSVVVARPLCWNYQAMAFLLSLQEAGQPNKNLPDFVHHLSSLTSKR